MRAISLFFLILTTIFFVCFVIALIDNEISYAVLCLAMAVIATTGFKLADNEHMKQLRNKIDY